MSKGFNMTLRWIGMLFMVLMLAFSTAAHWHPGPPVYPKPTQRWQALFDLDSRTTYTYSLKAYRRGRLNLEGQLHLLRAGDEISVWYEIGQTSGLSTTRYDPTAVAGAVLLAALQPTQTASWTELQLLATPFQFINWFDFFADGNFGGSVVWEIFGHPGATRFQITRTPGWFDAIYEGSVRTGRHTVLDMRIDLDEPLPLRVVTYAADGEWQFVAELVSSRQTTRPILR